MGDHDDDGVDLGAALFGYLLYREMRDGRIAAGDVFRLFGLVALAVGAILGGLLLIAILATPSRPAGSWRPAASAPAYAPPVTARPTARPSERPPTPRPSPSPSPAPSPSPSPDRAGVVGQWVPGADGWAVMVTKVEGWRPRGYREPGWRLVTAYVKVRLPAVDGECVFDSEFHVETPDGTSYEADRVPVQREPYLFDCADYHRPTTVAGWVTLEVRDADARGLTLVTCPWELFWCEDPVRIRLP